MKENTEPGRSPNESKISMIRTILKDFQPEPEPTRLLRVKAHFESRVQLQEGAIFIAEFQPLFTELLLDKYLLEYEATIVSESTVDEIIHRKNLLKVKNSSNIVTQEALLHEERERYALVMKPHDEKYRELGIAIQCDAGVPKNWVEGWFTLLRDAGKQLGKDIYPVTDTQFGSLWTITPEVKQLLQDRRERHFTKDIARWFVTHSSNTSDPMSP